MISKKEKIKFILGIIVLVLGVLWFNIILKLWLSEFGITQKLLDLIGSLINYVVLYVTVINSTFSQLVRSGVKDVYNSLTIWNLIGLVLGISLFIYSGIRWYGIKLRDIYEKYFINEK